MVTPQIADISCKQAFFNVILREFGVGGVKVQEVVGLDEELLAFLPYVFCVSLTCLIPDIHNRLGSLFMA